MRKISGFLLLLNLSFSPIVRSQVEVRNEPRHHNLLENSWVRLLEVRIPPGDTTLYHLHATPSVIVMLSHTKTASQILGENPAPGGYSTPGDCWYAPYGISPRKHRVWNEDTTLYHVMDIELLGTPHDTLAAVVPEEMKKALLFNQKEVTVYRINGSPHHSLVIAGQQHPLLLINIFGNIRCQRDEKLASLQAGNFLWVDAGQQLRIETIGQEASQWVLLDLHP